MPTIMPNVKRNPAASESQLVRSNPVLPLAMKSKDIDYYRSIHATRQPGVVAPVPYKDEIINQNSANEDVHQFFSLISAQWESTVEWISKAQTLVVMGYGFPQEDQHADYIFREAAARRGPNSKLEITVYERCDEGLGTRLARIVDIFRTGFTYKGPVEPN